MVAVLDLILRSLQGTITRAEIGRLTVWRRASLENERYFRQVEQIWRETGIARPGVLPPPPVPGGRPLAPRADPLD